MSGEVIDFKDGGKRGGARVVLKDDSGVFIKGRVSFPGAADISVGELYEYCFF
ncbi:hypothetical protein ORJ04_22425 [Rheinheimera baltica]|uniref:Uncharacterized protein n=1 Tax=Rheinheimera baltica TaxID=67576 RepID=A0ABT9I6K4_9GAMM|nr:hypothetical protein [Rheinheimera baltica]MDP5138708.1 hypothetical protein [Rheinheimera baltica]